MAPRHRPSIEGLGSSLAPVGLRLTGHPSRPYVACWQGEAVVLLPGEGSTRVAGQKLFGLSGFHSRRPTQELTLRAEPLAYLEQSVSKEVGGHVSIAGFRIGSGGLSKLTVAFVDKRRAVAIAKFPLARRAVGSLAHEVETIIHLGRFGRLSDHLPDVISRLALGGTEGTLFSAGPVDRVRRPGKEIISFLSALHEVTARRVTIHASGVVDSWLERLNERRTLFGPARSTTVERAIQLVQDGIGPASIDHTIAHGDFTRWNVRKGAGGLFVFDWEGSVTQALPYHDLFHYFAAESALLRRPWPRSFFNARRISAIAHRVSPTWTRLQPALYAAYLIQTTLWYAEVREWDSAVKPGPFWRFLWDELDRVANRTGPYR